MCSSEFEACWIEEGSVREHVGRRQRFNPGGVMYVGSSLADLSLSFSTLRYTTQVVVDAKGTVSGGVCPVQVLFCLKEQSELSHFPSSRSALIHYISLPVHLSPH